jgi:hypothetical protein
MHYIPEIKTFGAYLKNNFWKIILFIEYQFILMFYLVLSFFYLEKSELKHDVLFIEKCYQGRFRRSNKNDHYTLNRLALLDFKSLIIGKISIDSMHGVFKRIINSLRLLSKINREKNNPFIVVYFSTQLTNYLNPFILKYLKNNNTKIVCMLTDGSWPRNRMVVETYSSCFSFISCWDDPFFEDIKKSNVVKNSFSPFPAFIENFPKSTREIDISFTGRIGNRPDREGIVKFLKESDFITSVHTEQDGFLSTEDYYHVIKNSKIIINNSMSANQSESINQLKGRVFEAMLSGSLLFENKNELTSSLFVPNEHYIEYENFQDLIKLLDHHIKNFDKVGLEIAKNGHLRACEKFTGKKYWATIFREMENG